MTRNGPIWISIPVGSNEKRKIDEVMLPADQSWREKHVSIISQHYSNSPFFSELSNILFPILLDESITSLSTLNRKIIRDICSFLSIKAEFIDVRDLNANGGRVEKLIQICREVGAETYISGSAAKNYIGDEFSNTDVGLEWMEYGPFAEYPQLCDNFEHHVSIIDLIANTGPEARSFIG